MHINLVEAIEDFKNFIELPIFGRALYFKMQEYKDAIAANIDQFKNIEELRGLMKRGEKKLPKTSNDIEFELINVSGIWVTVFPGEKKIETPGIIPDKVVDYIVKEAENMEYGLIKQVNNLTIPGLKGKVFNLWFEKNRDDYITGIIKSKLWVKPDYKTDMDVASMLKELKNIDYDKMFEIFRLMFEKEKFREEIFKVFNIWKNVIEESAQ